MARTKKTAKINRSRSTASHRVIKRRTTKKRPFHKRIVLSPQFVFMFLIVGVLLVAWTLKAAADNVVVTARVAGTAPTTAATIDSPLNGTHFTSIPITVTGTCSANTYVAIYSNDVMSGSVVCSAGNNYSIQIGLLSGQNDLMAHIYNFADVEGPASSTVTVFYDPPVTPPEASGGGSSPNSSSPSTPPSSNNFGSGGTSSNTATSKNTVPFILKTDFSAKGYEVGQKINWTIEASGGSLPYAINVDWGDGTNNVISRTQEGKFTISHIYKNQGGYKYNYPVKISGSDARGNTSYLQFFVIINPENSKSFGGVASTDFPTSGNNWLRLAWPAYLVIALMASSYWLGEMEEIKILRKQRRMHH